MHPLIETDAIIDFCLAPLSLGAETSVEREVRRRMSHVIRTLHSKASQAVAVDFSEMPPLVINEAAHGYE